MDPVTEPSPINHCFPGMGVSTVSAARILRGQMEGQSGEETMLAMDTFPYVALSKVTIPYLSSIIHQQSRLKYHSVSHFKLPTGFHHCVALLHCLVKDVKM